MIHSASFFATGSDIAAWACVESAGLCLRTSSMTFSSASVSAWDVDDVAATAAVAGGVRAGGKAACWRVAGARAGTAGAAVAAGAGVFAAVFAAGAGFFAGFGPALRADRPWLGDRTFWFGPATPPQARKTP